MQMRRRLNTRRAQWRSSTTTARVRVGVAWYTGEQWAAVRAVATDPDNLEDTYEAWVAMAERALQELAQTGLRPEKVMIDSQALRAWCQRGGRPVDAEARAAFAAELLGQTEERKK
jgi:hypothetical protein